MSDRLPLISVIVPVYNTAGYLDACVKSITCQGFANYELLLIDDGSTDGSGVLCDAFVARDARIRCIHQENAGVSCARNVGLDFARGEYVWFCDSDDTVAEGALGEIAQSLISCRPDVLVFAVEQVDADGARLGLVPAPRPSLNVDDGPLQGGDELYPYAHVFRRVLAKDLRFDTSLALLEDRDFFYRICLKAAGHTAVVDKPLYRYLITREESAVNSSCVSKHISATKVQEAILESEIERGHPSPALEIFVNHVLGVLSRAYRCGAPKPERDMVKGRLMRWWDLRHQLPQPLYMKYLLAVKTPGIYALIAHLKGLVCPAKPGESVLVKSGKEGTCA